MAYRIWVGGLPSDIQDQDLLLFFQECGKIIECDIKRYSERSNYYAFISFETEESVKKALDIRDPHILNKSIIIDLCKGEKKYGRSHKTNESNNLYKNKRSRSRSRSKSRSNSRSISPTTKSSSKLISTHKRSRSRSNSPSTNKRSRSNSPSTNKRSKSSTHHRSRLSTRNKRRSKSRSPSPKNKTNDLHISTGVTRATTIASSFSSNLPLNTNNYPSINYQPSYPPPYPPPYPPNYYYPPTFAPPPLHHYTGYPPKISTSYPLPYPHTAIIPPTIKQNTSTASVITNTNTTTSTTALSSPQSCKYYIPNFESIEEMVKFYIQNTEIPTRDEQKHQSSKSLTVETSSESIEPTLQTIPQSLAFQKPLRYQPPPQYYPPPIPAYQPQLKPYTQQSNVAPVAAIIPPMNILANS